MSIPWQIFPATLMGIAIGVLFWNGKKMRRMVKDQPTEEDIRRAYPRAKIVTFRSRKAKD